jgi:hypothetical protein
MGPSGAVPHAGNSAPVRLPVPGPWKSPGVGPIGLVSVRPDQVFRRDSSEVGTRTPATFHGMSCPQCPQSPASCPQLQLRTRKASIHAGLRLIGWVVLSVLSRKRVKLSASAASRPGSVAALPPGGAKSLHFSQRKPIPKPNFLVREFWGGGRVGSFSARRSAGDSSRDRTVLNACAQGVAW